MQLLLLLFLLLIRVEFKKVEHSGGAGNSTEEETFTELIPCFISVLFFSTDFQQ